jgi:hypothetical protein
MPLQVLAKLKPKPRQWYLLRPQKVRAEPKGVGRVPITRRAITTLNTILVILGLVSLAMFGGLLYEGFLHGGFSGLSGIANALGLVVGLIVLALGIHLRE